jgi:hypothetical protein
MAEKPQPDPVPVDDPPPHPAEPLQIDTPVIQMQDIGHRPDFETRVSNSGVQVMPTRQDDEDALLALEQIEKSLRGQLPG